MKGIEKKVQEFRKNQERLNQIKKKMIDAEISWLTIRQALKLTQYEYQKLKAGDLEEREKDVLALIEHTPNNIKKRDAATKRFRKLLVDRGIGIKEFCESNNVNYNKLFRTLRGINVSRDVDIEKQVERALGVKVFY